MTHSETDKVSLEIAQRVAERLRARPDLLAVAQDNLLRWTQRNAGTPSLVRCYSEWQTILARPFEEILAVLCAETEEGQRLRQNSPFVGILSSAEVWQIKSAHRHATAAT